MKNILEQLYAGELVPAELKIEGNEEYETLCRRSLKEIENFTEKLDKENRKEFRKILSQKWIIYILLLLCFVNVFLDTRNIDSEIKKADKKRKRRKRRKTKGC